MKQYQRQLTKVKRKLFIIFIFIHIFFNLLNAKDYFPDNNWQVKKPAELGYSIKKFNKAKKYFEDSGATAIMVIDNGYIVADWGDTTRRVNSHSIRKSFMSTLFGIYVKEGDIDISDTLLDIGIDDKQKLTITEKSAKISDLLKSRSGVYHIAAYETKKMKKKRPKRGSHSPNTFYYYNNWDFNVLGTIFEKKTSQKIFEAFKNRIANPLQMQDFRISDGKYRKENISIHSAYPFWLSARDRARFGLLYLRKGKWKNKQIISDAWINESTISYSKVNKGIGYGYMWWVSTGNWHLGNKVKGKAYSARGYGGQYIIVLPKYNLLIVQVVDNKIKNKKVKKINKLLKLILDATNKV